MTRELGHPIQVLGLPSDTAQLPAGEKARLPAVGDKSELWGLAVLYDGNRGAGLVGLGRIDAGAWRHAPGRLLATAAHVWIKGDGTLRLVATTADRRVVALTAKPSMDLHDSAGLDLATLSFEQP